ncbi:MAG: chemotaxis protein CheW [Burkholderiales bacterium]|nr:chemotaxis protein CheW [Burkholderiales bacterium]
MARKSSLREFQQSLALRLREAASRTTALSRLGFQVGEDKWLVNLSDVSEVIPVPKVIPVPMTLPWYRGVANIRGKLYSIADFAAYQDQPPIGPGMERRVILVAERLIEGSGFMVSRMLGLHDPAQFTPEALAPEASRPWIKGAYRDAGGTRWYELDLSGLTRDARFLEIGIVTAAATT